MKYSIGRFLQLSGLISLPSSIWIAQFEHNEALSISVLAGSFVIFYLGFLLTRK